MKGLIVGGILAAVFLFITWCMFYVAGKYDRLRDGKATHPPMTEEDKKGIKYE